MEALAKLNVVLNYKGKEVHRILWIQSADWITERFSGVVTTPDGRETGSWVYDTYYELPLFRSRKGVSTGCRPIQQKIANAIYEWRRLRHRSDERWDCPF